MVSFSSLIVIASLLTLGFILATRSGDRPMTRLRKPLRFSLDNVCWNDCGRDLRAPVYQARGRPDAGPLRVIRLALSSRP